MVVGVSDHPALAEKRSDHLPVIGRFAPKSRSIGATTVPSWVANHDSFPEMWHDAALNSPFLGGAPVDEHVLRATERHVLEETGYNIRLEMKPMNKPCPF